MSIWDAYETDKTLETEGVWVEVRGGAKVKVRYLKTVEADAIRAKMFKRLRFLTGGADAIPPEVLQEMNLALLKGWVIAGWSGFTVRGSNEPLPCTPENIELVFSQMRELREEVLDVAGILHTFKATPVEEIAKNSLSTSGTGASTDVTPSPSAAKQPNEG